MRMSIYKNDPGYNEMAFLYRPFLDGVYIKNCVTADEEKGYIIRHQTDDDDMLMHDGKSILKEKLFGNVELRFRDDSQDSID